MTKYRYLTTKDLTYPKATSFAQAFGNNQSTRKCMALNFEASFKKPSWNGGFLLQLTA